nr:hypothetical protein [Tanacetum cinerariifolium]
HRQALAQRRFFRVFQAGKIARHGDGHQRGDDGHDHQQLNQRKTLVLTHGSPLRVGNAVEALAACFGVNVEHIFTIAGVLRRAVVGAQAPVVFRFTLGFAKRIAWNAAQEKNLGAL